MRFLLIFLGIIITNSLFGTIQTPDKLQYNLKELNIEFNRFGTILQQYYAVKNIRYPFESTGTNCYRGHIGHYKIINNQLFLYKINVDNVNSPNYKKPKDYDIKSSKKVGNAVLADWFSGVLHASSKTSRYYWVEKRHHYLFHIKNGKIIKKINLGRIPFGSTEFPYSINPEWFQLYDNFHSFYYNMIHYDSIQVNDSTFRFASFDRSPMFQYRGKDVGDWRYNWENDTCGVPVCSWQIQNDSFYLTNFDLHFGRQLSEDTTYVKNIDFKYFFDLEKSVDKVFADWVNGAYFIEEREKVPFKKSYRSKVKRLTFIHVENGIITRKNTISGDDYSEDYESIENENIQKIIEDYWNG